MSDDLLYEIRDGVGYLRCFPCNKRYFRTVGTPEGIAAFALALAIGTYSGWLTREAILNDDLDAIRKVPSKLAIAAARLTSASARSGDLS